jgi:hypothetical protein
VEIWTASAGNPFVAVETMRVLGSGAAVERGGAAHTDGALFLMAQDEISGFRLSMLMFLTDCHTAGDPF